MKEDRVLGDWGVMNLGELGEACNPRVGRNLVGNWPRDPSFGQGSDEVARIVLSGIAGVSAISAAVIRNRRSLMITATRSVSAVSDPPTSPALINDTAGELAPAAPAQSLVTVQIHPGRLRGSSSCL